LVKHERDIDSPDAREKFQRLKSKLFTEPTATYMISHEGFSNSGDAADCFERARRLKTLFPESHILITIRNQLEIVGSMYLHGLKGSIARNQSFDEWIDAHLKQLPDAPRLQWLDYSQLCDFYVKLFGQENVKVMLFEHFKSDYRSFLTDLSRYLGVDGTTSQRIYEHRQQNPRLTTSAMGITRFYSRYFSGTWIARLIPPRISKKVYSLITSIGRPMEVSLSEERVAELSKLYKTGNDKLAEEFRLPLGDYGYPM
jgi:hypothetical protein